MYPADFPPPKFMFHLLLKTNQSLPAMACNPTAAYDDAFVAIARKGAP